jgi:beta-lactam-binding protein with PASTA domain
MRKTICAVAAVTAAIGLAASGGPDFAGAPDVRGLNLADANEQLRAAGYESSVTETDAMFGVIVEANFAVCEQGDTRGHMVPVEVAKRGC